MAIAALFFVRGGCGAASKTDRDPTRPLLEPLGPEVIVDIADAARAAVIIEGPVDLLRAEDGARLVHGRLEATSERVQVTVEAGRLRIGDVSDPGPVEIRPAARASGGAWHLALELEGSAAPRRFRGSFVVSTRDSRLRFTNKLSLEEYLAAVVGSEMAASAVPIEALKAQAVAARTYALFALESAEARGREARFRASSAFQAYGGVEKEHPRAIEAVLATSGKVLTYQGGLFRSYFHSTCGGRTVDASRVFGEPSIEPLAGADCGACAGARFASWESSWSPAEVEDALRAWAAQRGVTLGAVEAVEVSEAEPDGRARYVRVRHAGGSFEVLASKLRALLGGSKDAPLRSAAFTVAKEGGLFRFEGRGWGHGVGLCQTGAAKKGETESYDRILSDYFPGSAIERAY